MSAIDTRAKILKVYPGWKDKVNKMTDIQINAIYMNLLKRGILK